MILLLCMPDVFAGDFVFGFAAFGGGHDADDVGFGIDDQFVGDRAHAGELADNLFG